MLTRLLSIEKVCRAVKRSTPYVRGLADSGLIDSYVVEPTGWRAFPKHAIDQIRAHQARQSEQAAEQA
jgi:hypothetical protein